MDANTGISSTIPAGQELPAASPPREPAANALRHGLSGQKYLPPGLHPGRIDEIYTRLQRELSPRTFLDELALREVARHAALLEIVEQGEPAVLRLAAQQVAGLFVVDGETDDDVAIAAAVTAEPLDRVARYRRGHEKALNAAIDKLAVLRRSQAADAPLDQTKRVDPFGTITACEDCLRQRFESAEWRCPHCNKPSGAWSDRLLAWVCGACKKRVGLREGTIFSRSPIPLPVWFRAIRVVAANVQIAASELAQAVGIKRVATARRMLGLIVTVLRAPDHGGLADLVSLVVAPSGVQRGCNLQNEPHATFGPDGAATEGACGN